MTMRLGIVAVLSACAIHPPPPEPPEPPETWTKPSVRNYCDAKCRDVPEPHLARCVNRCEQNEPVWFCGTERLMAARESGLPRSIALPIGLAGIVVISLLAAGVIAPSP